MNEMSDFMELGQSSMVPIANGWWLDKITGYKISPDGEIFSATGEMIGKVNFEDGPEED